MSFLEAEFPGLEAPRNAGIAFTLAERYRDLGDLAALQNLCTSEDPVVLKWALNALWDPGVHGLGPGIVALALTAAAHPDARIRTEVCFVLMNQADYGTDVTPGIEPLLHLLSDPDGSVRRQAAYAVKTLAKARRYDLSAHLHQLAGNLPDLDRNARVASAAALWELSRRRYDIGPAVRGLLAILALQEDVGDQYKNAVGALLHHARKSPEHAQAVAEAVVVVELDREHKTICRLLEELVTQSS